MSGDLFWRWWGRARGGSGSCGTSADRRNHRWCYIKVIGGGVGFPGAFCEAVSELFFDEIKLAAEVIFWVSACEGDRDCSHGSIRCELRAEFSKARKVMSAWR